MSLDDLYPDKRVKKVERLDMNFKVPFAFKLTGQLIIGVVVGGSACGLLSLISGATILNPGDDFMTSDENERVLIEQTQRYCRPNAFQVLANGFDKGTCRQKLHDMSQYLAAKDKGEQPEVNQDILSMVDNNRMAFRHSFEVKKEAGLLPEVD